MSSRAYTAPGKVRPTPITGAPEAIEKRQQLLHQVTSTAESRIKRLATCRVILPLNLTELRVKWHKPVRLPDLLFDLRVRVGWINENPPPWVGGVFKFRRYRHWGGPTAPIGAVQIGPHLPRPSPSW